MTLSPPTPKKVHILQKKKSTHIKIRGKKKKKTLDVNWFNLTHSKLFQLPASFLEDQTIISIEQNDLQK